MLLDFFPFGFFLIWITANALLSVLGGWYETSQRFKYTGVQINFDKWCYFISGSFGLVNYGGCLQLGISKNGILLKTFPPLVFSFLHPTLFLPWEFFQTVQIKKYWFIKRYMLRSKTSPELVIFLPKSAAEMIQKYSG